MNFDSESTRLYKLYDGKTNDELVELNRNREDLTDAAQEALATVMRERKLATDEDQADGSPTASTAVDGESDLDANEVSLWSFDDMFQAKTAVQLLDGVRIPYRLIDHSRESVGRRGVALLELVINGEDVDAAMKLLHEQMGLVWGSGSDDADATSQPLGDLFGVLVFDSETEMKEGLAAAQALGAAGISYFWHDGRDSPAGLPDEKTIAIEVAKANLARARAVVEASQEA